MTRNASFAMLLAIAAVMTACSDPTSPGEPTEYRSVDYMWSPARSPYQYRSLSDDPNDAHRLQFSLNSSSIRDEHIDGSQTVLESTMLAMSSGNGTFVLGGCNEHTLFHIPPHLRFADYHSTQTGPIVMATRMLSLDPTTLLVAEKSGGMYRYDLPSKLWTVENMPGANVTSLCMDSTATDRRIFAGTRNDGIYTRRVSDSSWQRLPAPAGIVQDLEADVSRGIFAVINKSLHYSRPPFSAWERFALQPGSDDLTDIAIIRYSATEAWLYTASERSGIGEMLLIGNAPVRYSFESASLTGPIHRICADVSAAFPVVAAGSSPTRLLVAPQPGLWIPLSVNFTINDVQQSRRGPRVFIAKDDGLDAFDGVSFMSSGLQGRKVISIHVSPAGDIYCGTDAGTYLSRDDGASWIRIDMTTIMTNSRTGLIVMPSRLWKGFTWEAARLTPDGIIEHAVTGRVLEHLDELRLPDGLGTYTDVLVIRYAQETENGGVRPGTAYWTSYFVRNIGLALIERNGGDGEVTRMALPAPL